MKRMTKVATILLILGGVSGLLSIRLFFIKDTGGGGVLLWRNGDAYLFLYDGPIGYRLRGVAWLLEPIMEYFSAPAFPDDDANLLTVIHVNPSGVARFIQQSSLALGSFTPVGDSIYCSCPGGTCKWTGSRFELISPGDENQTVGQEHLVPGRIEFANNNGWSKHVIRSFEPGETPIKDQFSVDLNRELRVVAIEGNPTLVELQRPNRSDEQIWYHNNRTVLVSEAQYKLVFGRN
jgi:hypothetical protein